jgi:hypothetical protein
MHRGLLIMGCVTAVGACKTESPAGTVVAEWSYEVDDAAPLHVPVSKRPRKMATATGEWPVSGGAPMKLKFETEIGDLPSDVHWDWPLHVRITLAEPTRAKLPQVLCMPGPPGNKLVDGVVVRPLGRDGVTPSGLVACFVNGKTLDESYVFDIDGDGQVTRAIPTH